MDGIDRYRVSEVESADPARLVVVAYDGAIAFLLRAQNALEGGRPHEAAPHIFRAKRIILHLLASLDASAGDVTVNLERLYAFVLRRLAEAALARDAAALEDGLRILSGLRGAWAQVAEAAALEPAAEVSAASSAVSVTG